MTEDKGIDTVIDQDCRSFSSYTLMWCLEYGKDVMRQLGNVLEEQKGHDRCLDSFEYDRQKAVHVENRNKEPEWRVLYPLRRRG